MRTKSKAKKILMGVLFVAVFAASIAIVMLLWNALIPSIIGWSAINYWQAAGLMILSRLLLGGFGRFGHRGGRGKGHLFHKDDRHAHFHEFGRKMKEMSPDERREYIRKHMRAHSHPFQDEFSGSEKREND